MFVLDAASANHWHDMTSEMTHTYFYAKISSFLIIIIIILVQNL